MSAGLRLLVTGGSGMIGQGLLREALREDRVARVLSLGRRPTGVHHGKLEEVLVEDLFDPAGYAEALCDIDACVFCLGVSAGGVDAESYRRITRELTLSLARALRKASPGASFQYVSGAGTGVDKRARWAQVKGRVEAELLELGFPCAWMLRPGVIRPRDGIRSRTPAYRRMYTLLTPFWPVILALGGRSVIDTRQLGRAMLRLAIEQPPSAILEAKQLHDLGSTAGSGK